MITFITGLPGAGKTLLTLELVQEYAEAENKLKDTEAGETLRPVYYSGISSLKLDWIEMDAPEQWHKLPVGSIIVIDESQKIFPNLSNGAKRPTHYTEFQTHRHNGYDIFLLTQDATLVDSSVRALANRHIHQSRSFGLETATQYEWQAVNSTKPYALKMDTDAVKKQWKFPKHLYGSYKSAEQHTHKRRLPYKKIVPIILLGVFGITAIIYMLYQITQPDEIPVREPDVSEQPIQSLSDVAVKKPSQSDGLFSEIDRFVPTVPNLPMSAPIYHRLVQVRDYPRIQGCLKFEINNTIECRCDDQQGHQMAIDTLTCMSWIRTGSFDYTIASTQQKSRSITNKSEENSLLTSP